MFHGNRALVLAGYRGSIGIERERVQIYNGIIVQVAVCYIRIAARGHADVLNITTV